MQGGSVYVSATETSLHCFLLEKLGLFHDRHPQIRLKITNVSTTQAIENVVSGRSDFAFVASPAEAPSPLKQTDLHPFRDILIGNANYIELAHGSYRLKDLKKYPLISLSRSASSAYIFYQAVYAKAGLEFRPEIEYLRFDYTFYSPQFGRGICSRRIGAARVEGWRNRKNSFERGNPGTYCLRGL